MADEQGPWDRLAAAVVARRNARGWTQVEVANRGDLSLDRLQAIEGVRATSYRPKTMQALERGLEWTPGSVARVLAGDQPEEIEKARTARGEPLLDLLDQISGGADATPIPLLDSVMKRMYSLDLSEGELIARTAAGVDRRFVLFGRPSRDGLRRSLERALQWEPGTVRNFLLAGADEQYDDLEVEAGGRAVLYADESLPVAPGEVIHSEAMTIGRSGLPQDVQDDLVQYVARRRREFNVSLADDLDAVIDLAKRATDGKL